MGPLALDRGPLLAGGGTCRDLGRPFPHEMVEVREVRKELPR
jgi:hypothetical protein